MRRTTYSRGGKTRLKAARCIQCKRKRFESETFSWAGLCHECTLVNRVAQWLGLDYVTHWNEDINGRITGWYSGKVQKAA